MAVELKALLVAAGTGTRLKPLTDVLPKCLMPINGRPLLGIWLEILCDAGIGEIIVNLHHHAALVRAYIERSPYAGRVTLALEKTLLGTGGTLMHHRDQLGGGPTLFAHADNLSAFDMGRFLGAHRSRPPEAIMTMMTFTTDAPERCGIVKLDDRRRVVAFHEKSPEAHGNIANAAIYLLEAELLSVLEKIGKPVVEFSTDVLPKMLDRVHTYHNDVYHRDIGTVASLARAQLDYFCAARLPGCKRSADDPWYGLMSENNAALASAFAKAVDAAFSDVAENPSLRTPAP